MNPPYSVIREQNFIDQFQEAYDWLLESNFELTQDIDLSEQRANHLIAEVKKVVAMISRNPSVGSLQVNSLFRFFTVHDGRYSIVWFFDGSSVRLLGFPDNKHPAEMRYLLEGEE